MGIAYLFIRFKIDVLLPTTNNVNMERPVFYKQHIKLVKSYTDDITRRQTIEQLIDEIYSFVLTIAATSDETVARFCLEFGSMFIRDNIGHIITILECIFPDCSISHTLLAIGTDGKYHDVASIGPHNLPMINSVLPNSYIVIDWS